MEVPITDRRRPLTVQMAPQRIHPPYQTLPRADPTVINLRFPLGGVGGVEDSMSPFHGVAGPRGRLKPKLLHQAAPLLFSTVMS